MGRTAAWDESSLFRIWDELSLLGIWDELSPNLQFKIIFKLLKQQRTFVISNLFWAPGQTQNGNKNQPSRSTKSAQLSIRGARLRRHFAHTGLLPLHHIIVQNIANYLKTGKMTAL